MKQQLLWEGVQAIHVLVSSGVFLDFSICSIQPGVTSCLDTLDSKHLGLLGQTNFLISSLKQKLPQTSISAL